MIVFGYGISLDVDHLPFAILDFDGTPASRLYADSFRGSFYFTEHRPISSYEELDRRLRNGELRFAIEIPAKISERSAKGAPAGSRRLAGCRRTFPRRTHAQLR